MHLEAYQAFGNMVKRLGLDERPGYRILDVGGQDVNSTGQGFVLYNYFNLPKVTTLDLYRADIIADAAVWEPDRQFDVVMATELFEHIDSWRDVIAVMRRALDPAGEGVFLSTCASTGRAPHGMHGDMRPARGEWYGNVGPKDLKAELRKHFGEAVVEYQNPPGDAYAWARL